MKKDDVFSSLFWIGFGVLFCVGAFKYGLITTQKLLGPGGLPLVVGAAVIFLSCIVLVSAIVSRTEEKIRVKKERSFAQWDRLGRQLIAVAGLFAYGMLLNVGGYTITTFLFMIFAVRLIEPRRWKSTLLFSFLVAVGSRALFSLLNVELPTGLLGI